LIELVGWIHEKMSRTRTPRRTIAVPDSEQIEMHAQFQRFLKDAAASKVPLPRARLGNKIWTVYVRLNLRLVEGQVRHCLDVASCEIAPDYQGRGLFSTLMHVLQNADQAPYEMIYAGQVQTPLVEEWCRRHGWHLVEAEPPAWPPSYYLLLGRKKDALT
jgi:GNAT superfamily N-acetyltransferase